MHRHKEPAAYQDEAADSTYTKPEPPCFHGFNLYFYAEMDLLSKKVIQNRGGQRAGSETGVPGIETSADMFKFPKAGNLNRWNGKDSWRLWPDQKPA
jgi:hypothetical protein